MAEQTTQATGADYDVAAGEVAPHEAQNMAQAGGAPLNSSAEHGGQVHHEEPNVAGFLDATVFVSLAMTVFIVILLWKGVPALIARGLDKQIAAIRSRLDEAAALRTEAEALRDEYARKLSSVETEVAGMMGQAEQEAQAILAKAEQDAEALVARRTRMAEDKIAAAERAALDEVRARAAEAAAQAAEQLIRDRLDAGADKRLVDQAIQGLGRAH